MIVEKKAPYHLAASRAAHSDSGCLTPVSLLSPALPWAVLRGPLNNSWGATTRTLISMGNWDGLQMVRWGAIWLPDTIIRLLLRIFACGSQTGEIIPQRQGTQRPARLSQAQPRDRKPALPCLWFQPCLDTTAKVVITLQDADQSLQSYPPQNALLPHLCFPFVYQFLFCPADFFSFSQPSYLICLLSFSIKMISSCQITSLLD